MSQLTPAVNPFAGPKSRLAESEYARGKTRPAAPNVNFDTKRRMFHLVTFPVIALTGTRKAAGFSSNPAARALLRASCRYATFSPASSRAISAATSAWCSRYSACAFLGFQCPYIVKMNGTNTTTQPMQT